MVFSFWLWNKIQSLLVSRLQILNEPRHIITMNMNDGSRLKSRILRHANMATLANVNLYSVSRLNNTKLVHGDKITRKWHSGQANCFLSRPSLMRCSKMEFPSSPFDHRRHKRLQNLGTFGCSCESFSAFWARRLSYYH